MWLGRSVLCATLAVVLLGVALSARSDAHDSLAPPGAHHNWLPTYDWVLLHWVPFDEADLDRRLGVDTPALYEWLSDDHHTLAQLVRRKGLEPRQLVEDLIAPYGATPLLRRHARRMFSQGHLAQHVIFHVYHGPHVSHHAWEILGVSRARFLRLRQRRLTPLQIAARGHVPAHHVRMHVFEELRDEARRGVAEGQTPRAQARRMLRRQEKLLGCWMRTPLAKFDKDNPYGDPLGGHGEHDRDSRVGVVNPKPAQGCWRSISE